MEIPLNVINVSDPEEARTWFLDKLEEEFDSVTVTEADIARLRTCGNPEVTNTQRMEAYAPFQLPVEAVNPPGLSFSFGGQGVAVQVVDLEGGGRKFLLFDSWRDGIFHEFEEVPPLPTILSIIGSPPPHRCKVQGIFSKVDQEVGQEVDQGADLVLYTPAD